MATIKEYLNYKLFNDITARNMVILVLLVMLAYA